MKYKAARWCLYRSLGIWDAPFKTSGPCYLVKRDFMDRWDELSLTESGSNSFLKQESPLNLTCLVRFQVSDNSLYVCVYFVRSSLSGKRRILIFLKYKNFSNFYYPAIFFFFFCGEDWDRSSKVANSWAFCNTEYIT